MTDGLPETIGQIRWSIHNTATSSILSAGEKQLQIQDVTIRFVNGLYAKKISLGEHFYFVLSESGTREKASGKGGFGFGIRRDDIPSFGWEWFDVDCPGYAKKLQESGELSFDEIETANGIEIWHMEFLTDVSMRLSRMPSGSVAEPEWRILVYKGFNIKWPALIDNEVQSL